MSRATATNEAMHRIGADGWPDAIWEGVNNQTITLHLDHDRFTRGYVEVKTPDGVQRGEVGDLIIRNARGQFYILHQPAKL